jgi:hypothetical protein
MNNDKDLIKLIYNLRIRPIIAIWRHSMTLFSGFLDGYMYKLKDENWWHNLTDWFDFDTFEKFEKYIYEKTTGKDTWRKRWLFYHEAILEVVDGDEKAWLDLFFKLFLEFIEKEWINTDELDDSKQSLKS